MFEPSFKKTPANCKITSQKIEELSWEKISYLRYFSDLASSDCHLLRSLQNHLQEILSQAMGGVETDIAEFFASKPKQFYNYGINKLIDRWKDGINNQEI